MPEVPALPRAGGLTARVAEVFSDAGPLALGVEGGSDVLEVQRRLQLLGYYRGDLDGFYGPVTAEAVRAFQQDTGLMPDAIVGPRTYERLEAAYDIAVDWTMP